MPDLNATLHLDMLTRSKGRRSLPLRILKAVSDSAAPYRFIRDRYLLPYIKAVQCAAEIGRGVGHWTRYLLAFKKLFVVDYYSELLDEVKRRFRRPNVTFSKNDGVNSRGIDDGSIDYLFSFGTLSIWIYIA